MKVQFYALGGRSLASSRVWSWGMSDALRAAGADPKVVRRWLEFVRGLGVA